MTIPSNELTNNLSQAFENLFDGQEVKFKKGQLVNDSELRVQVEIKSPGADRGKMYTISVGEANIIEALKSQGRTGEEAVRGWATDIAKVILALGANGAAPIKEVVLDRNSSTMTIDGSIYQMSHPADVGQEYRSLQEKIQKMSDTLTESRKAINEKKREVIGLGSLSGKGRTLKEILGRRPPEREGYKALLDVSKNDLARLEREARDKEQTLEGYQKTLSHYRLLSFIDSRIRPTCFLPGTTSITKVEEDFGVEEREVESNLPLEDLSETMSLSSEREDFADFESESVDSDYIETDSLISSSSDETERDHSSIGDESIEISSLGSIESEETIELSEDSDRGGTHSVNSDEVSEENKLSVDQIEEGFDDLLKDIESMRRK